MNHSRAARLGLQGIALTILTACGPSRDHFEDVYADRVCALYFECEEPLISEVYESEDACYDGSVEDRQEIDCEYDAKEARGCLHLVRTMDCEAFAEGDWMVECSTPYDCSGGCLHDTPRGGVQVPAPTANRGYCCSTAPTSLSAR